MKLEDIDIGLLLALEAVLVERNVTRAAGRLNISQSTLSTRIRRLRKTFGDSLFVPAVTGRGVIPTPKALELQPVVRNALATLRRMMEGPMAFDPARSERTFTLASYDNPALVLVPKLIALMKRAAPRARLSVIQPSSDTVQRMESGDVDLMVTDAKRPLANLMKRPLLQDRFMTGRRKGHPGAGQRFDLDAFCHAEHMLVASESGGFWGRIDDALAVLGRSRRVGVSIQSYALAPAFLANTDYICTLPGRFLSRFSAQLELLQPPFALQPLQLVAVWHPARQEDDEHSWFRELLYQAARESDGSPRALSSGADLEQV